MAAPRVSFEKSTPPPVNAPTKGFEFFESPEAPANQLARQTNQKITAIAGNENFPTSVPDEARRNAKSSGLGKQPER